VSRASTHGALNPLGSVGVLGDAGEEPTGVLGVTPLFDEPLGKLPGVGVVPTKPLFGPAGLGDEPGILPLPAAGGTPPGAVP